MRNFKIRKAQADDLSNMQDIARRTIDQSYRSFLGDNGVGLLIAVNQTGNYRITLKIATCC